MGYLLRNLERKKQINRATIGAGKIIVDGKETNPNINRDEKKAQEITKDISVKTIDVAYTDNARKWSEVATIMGEHGTSLGKDLDTMTDKLADKNYNLENKLGNSLKDITFEVEKVLDHDLKNSLLGLIPTEEYTGGIAGQLQEPKKRYYDGDQELIYAEIKVATDKDGKLLYDRNGKPLIDSQTKIVKSNDKIGEDVRVKPLPANGVYNNLNEAIAGGVASTFSDDEDKALRNGESIKVLLIHNKSAGLVPDALETLVTKAMGSYNWGGRSMEKIYRTRPELMKYLNWHSQSTINGTAAFLHMGKDEEGRKLLANNVEKLGLKGIAITSLGYNKLDNLLHELNPNINLYYMRNQKEPVSFVAAWGMKTNTTGEGHDNIGYNDGHYNFNKSSGIYEREVIKIIKDGKEEEVDVPNFEYQMRIRDGSDQRSIFERMRDNRAQQGRM